jgi:hypothetical protein
MLSAVRTSSRTREESGSVPLATPIVFENFRAVRNWGHSSPDSLHRVKDLRLLTGSHACSSGERTQLGDRLSTPLDHNDAALGSLAHQLRRVNVKLTDRSCSHVPDCLTVAASSDILIPNPL